MKRTFPVNINGKVYYIDEDAFELLSNYLRQIKSAFSKNESEEIVSDIESRISELFDERISAGAHAIVFSDVNNVIEIMGKPSDIGDFQSEPDQDGTAKSDQEQDNGSHTPPPIENKQKKLYRNMDNKIFGGVLGGIATYLDWNANIMRILYVVLTFVTQFWPLTILYLIAWMIIPAANTPRRVLEMYGRPVTIKSIGENILSTITPSSYDTPIKNSDSKIFHDALSFIGKCIISLLGLAGTATAIVATGFFLYFLISLIAYSCFDSTTLIYEFYDDYIYHVANPGLISMAYICMSVCFITLGTALGWFAASVLFNCKAASKSTIISALILELIFVVATIVLMIFTHPRTLF